MATEKPRYSITMDEELFNAIEDFRFENRYQTRNLATLDLIRMGLEAAKEKKNRTQKGSLGEEAK